MNMRKIMQKDLCKITGINKSTLSLYVAGKRHATDYNMYILAKALNVDLEWLMGYSDNDGITKRTTRHDELAKLVNEMTEDECEKLIGFIHEFFRK